MSAIPRSLQEYIFADVQKGEAVYSVLDGASIPDLLDHLYGEIRPEFECLYRGELEPDIAEVAPYLVLLTRDSEFSSWLLAKGWGEHWGMFAIAAADFPAMHRQFRKFLTVHDPDGKPLLFRYYDPRVLRAYLPTCNEAELKNLFGPIRCFVVEGEDSKTAVRFHYEAGGLHTETLPVSQGQ
jgi:hypothetical protein